MTDPLTPIPRDEPFTWQAHPARQRPAAALGACAVIAAIVGAVWLSFDGWWAAGSAAVLLAALNRFFLPSRFVADAQGITARHPLRTLHLRWSEVRRFVHDQYGGYLSRRARPSRMDAFGGMHLLFGPDRAGPIEAIQRRMAAGTRPAPGTAAKTANPAEPALLTAGGRL